jgi:zinc transport system ATP-binding protein
MAQITCENLKLGYDGKEILKGLNFTVNSGDYLCIVGENGSGKTTLMKTLLGLHTPMDGTITFGDDLKRTEIGYLPQQTVVQRDFPASVEEIVRSGCQGRSGLRPFYNKAEKQLAADNIAKMGLKGMEKRCYRELSGGQQQRVLLCRALCAAGELLILDEPVTGLDPTAAQDLYRTLHYLNKSEGIAIVMVTHDIQNALRYATTILHAGNGKWFCGSTEDYLASPYGKRFGGEKL